MRRAEVVYRPDAIADLQQIYRGVAEASQSHDVASRFVRRIMERCRKIGNVPQGGRARDDLMPGLRTVPFERRAVIAYIVADRVEITNIFYGGRDYDTLYHDRPGDD